MGSAVNLEYVKWNDSIFHVDKFLNVDRKMYSPVCPSCGADVILKLGEIKAHHAAHKSIAACYGESAEHLNAKYKLLLFFKNTNKFEIFIKCKSEYSCGNRKIFTFAENWKGVEVEYQIGKFRADVGLVSLSGSPIAIEVFRSHAISTEKAAWFNENNIQWIEVSSLDVSLWPGTEPLHYIRGSVSHFTCEACIKAEQDKKKRWEDFWSTASLIREYENKLSGDYRSETIYWYGYEAEHSYVPIFLIWEDRIDELVLGWRVEYKQITEIVLPVESFVILSDANLDIAIKTILASIVEWMRSQRMIEQYGGYSWRKPQGKFKRFYQPKFNPNAKFLSAKWV